MQDNYVADIGDYGKYGLLRIISSQGLSLAVNWYNVKPKKPGKQDDGKYINYLNIPQSYRKYDPELFDSLYKIAIQEKDRHISRIENEKLFPAYFFSDEIGTDRYNWHLKSLKQTAKANVVFLDPDNGLETQNMFLTDSATEKHVKWAELKEYYARGQNVILYQHRPQMTKKEKCIDSIMHFQMEYLKADHIKLLEYPKYTNRFYFIFLHDEYLSTFEKICDLTIQKWGENNFCKEINI